MRLHLVWNWNDSWKWISVQIGALQISGQTAVLAGLALMDETQRIEFIRHWFTYYVWVTMVLTFLQTFGRLINQSPPQPGMPDRTVHAQPGENIQVIVPETKKENPKP